MKQRGFTLVELLVAVLVGMLALVFATRLVANAESTKQSSLGGSDAMQNGMLAMFSISADAAQAGWGMNDAMMAGCNTRFQDSDGYAMPQLKVNGSLVTPLAPALIVAGGSKPDLISLNAGSSVSGTGSLRVVDDTSGPTIAIDRIPYGFALGDAILVAPEESGSARCALAMITSDPNAAGAGLFLQAAGGGRYNGSDFGASYKASQARVFNLGQASKLAFHTWSVDKGFLRLRASNLAGAQKEGSTVADNVVSIKAQYGLDMRDAAAFLPNSGLMVSQWSATMVDADGDGIAGDPGDFQRIAALRLAVVARSRAPERAKPGKDCDATADKPTVFASEAPSGIAGVPITVDVAVASDPVDWHCYRYRVFETIVPLRNSGWRPK